MTVAMISYFIFSFDFGVLVTVLSKFNYSDYKKGVKKLKTQSMYVCRLHFSVMSVNLWCPVS
jgi:hypothetical protein